MDVASIISPQSAQPSGATSQLTENFDTFLTLLTAQLRNQDPLDPLDTEKFTSQLVQFSAVEQSIQTNSHLETLIGLQAAADRDGALSMIGKTVSVDGDTAFNSGAGGQWSYTLPDGAATVQLTLVDASGRTIAQYAGNNRAGEHQFVWDGQQADGKPAPDGAYRLIVEAVDGSGAPSPFLIQSSLNVSGVAFDPAGPQLETAIGQISLSAVNRVFDRL